MVLNLKYRQLKAFTLALESGSFTAAADRMAVTQPSFSALVKELEHDVGVTLFDRTTRRCAPTDSGRAFYEQVRPALEQIEDAYRQLKEVGAGSRGRLALAALPSLASGVVTAQLAEFRRRHPHVRITLREHKNEEILAAVRNGAVEFGVGALPRPEPDLVFEPLFADRLMYVVPRGHPLEAMRPAWKLAQRFDLILMNAGPVEHALRASHAAAQPAFEVEHAATALAMVRQGLGVAVLPSSSVADLRLDGLACCPMVGPRASRELGIVRKRDARFSAAAAAFAAMLVAAADAPARRRPARGGAASGR